jgi:hypothetical protein
MARWSGIQDARFQHANLYGCPVLDSSEGYLDPPVGSHFYDVVNLIRLFPPRRYEPGENHAEHTVFDRNNRTDFDLRFVGMAYQGLPGCFLHSPIVAL